MTPELHRPLTVARVGSAGLDFVVEASGNECAALATRMKLPAVLSLTCRYHLERDLGETLMVRGHLAARILQTCVISSEDFTTTVEERFAVRCVAAGTESDNPDPDAPDEIIHVDGTVDLGEAAAEQLALALDPYPHAPDAALPEVDFLEADFPETDIEAELHPFAALKHRQ
jgi:uncharacterized metal-binding protein YceD (DUF177 family)